ncbi:MAG TPA: alpha/beta hydrolase [Micromonosporaceae bacterium]
MGPAEDHRGLPRALRWTGALGALVGTAAAGVTAAAAAQRALVRRARRELPDPYAGERFGALPYHDRRVVTAADGTDVYVEIVEPEQAENRPTLIFVHGFCLNLGSFHFQRKALVEQGFRMVFYDQPGHGRSGRLESGEYEFPALAAALRAVIDETTPSGPLVLIGHSMGGMTLMALAECHPDLFGDRVVGVALIATSAGLTVQTKSGLSALVARFGGSVLPLARTTRFTGGVIDRARLAAGDLAWLLTRRFAFGGERPSPALVSYVEQMNSSTTVDTIARYVRAIYTHARHPALAALHATPTLVVAGEQDRIIPVEHSEEIVRRLPDAEFVRVPDSGHMVLMEHADEVNAALTDFLGRLGA